MLSKKEILDKEILLGKIWLSTIVQNEGSIQAAQINIYPNPPSLKGHIQVQKPTQIVPTNQKANNILGS